MGGIRTRLKPMSRSENLRRIKSEDTSPEMAVRRAAWSLGCRYRLHVKGLPGKPDLVFKGRDEAIFVHGCSWHQHMKSDCKYSRLPRSNADYWVSKLKRTFDRDTKKPASIAGHWC